MNRQEREHDPKSLRQRRIARREAIARSNGWSGPWPPDKPCIESAADCQNYLSRLEAGEQRAGFLTALGKNLVAFFEHLQPEHFRRFAAVLLKVAENPQASHRTRLRAVQAAIRPLQRTVMLLPRLEKAGERSLQAHLESLLLAFCRELSTDGFGRLARVLMDLSGPAAKEVSDKVRACEAALTTVTQAMGMLAALTTMQQHRAEDMNDPEMRGRWMEEADRELAEMEAEIQAGIEEGRRAEKPISRN